jgi:hypothetical protein
MVGQRDLEKAARLPNLGPIEWNMVVLLVCLGGPMLLIGLCKCLMHGIDRRGNPR